MTDQIIHRDTITGQTVTAEYAKAHPDTTVRETRRAGKWRRRAEVAEAKLEAVRELTSDPSLEDEWAHNGHDEDGGEPECPGCWAFALLRIIDATEEADR